MTIKNLPLLSCPMLLGLASAAHAGLRAVPLNELPGFDATASRSVPTDDTVGTLVGAYLEGHNFDLSHGLAVNGGASTQPFPSTNAFIGNNIFYKEPEPILFSMSSIPGPNPDQHTITLEWRMQDGVDFVPSGSGIFGQSPYTVSFEFGMKNGLANGLEFDQPFVLNHETPFPDTNPGLYGVPFKLFDSQGGILLNGPFYGLSLTPENELVGRSAITTASGSIAGADIVRAEVQFTITFVPEPSSLVLLGATCVLLPIRRRH
ncbi:MAG TPA: PEP-CTERM sorting domain-containing protein [Phycisphaerae bacterium]|nr:PEP-CTERM sorting domain-containing protein [Phycisphaerae bacterium]